MVIFMLIFAEKTLDKERFKVLLFFRHFFYYFAKIDFLRIQRRTQKLPFIIS